MVIYGNCVVVELRKVKDQINLETRVKEFKKCSPSISTGGARYNHCEFNKWKDTEQVKSEEVTKGEGSESNKGINNKNWMVLM